MINATPDEIYYFLAKFIQNIKKYKLGRTYVVKNCDKHYALRIKVPGVKIRRHQTPSGKFELTTCTNFSCRSRCSPKVLVQNVEKFYYDTDAPSDREWTLELARALFKQYPEKSKKLWNRVIVGDDYLARTKARVEVQKYQDRLSELQLIDVEKISEELAVFYLKQMRSLVQDKIPLFVIDALIDPTISTDNYWEVAECGFRNYFHRQVTATIIDARRSFERCNPGNDSILLGPTILQQLTLKLTLTSEQILETLSNSSVPETRLAALYLGGQKQIIGSLLDQADDVRLAAKLLSKGDLIPSPSWLFNCAHIS